MILAGLPCGAWCPALLLSVHLLDALTVAPNIIAGPTGFGPEHWVNGATPMQYRVDFENLPGVASAPAQVVRIVVPIDPNLDPTTFRVGNMGFGGVYQIGVPAGRTSYSMQTFYSALNLSVRVTVGINLTTREASWVFTTIDPVTGQQPTNPYIGFLPVNDDLGRGTGFATYSIQPYANAALGSTVQAQASNVFESGDPPAWTQTWPTAPFSNRLDSAAPVSHMGSTGIVVNPSTVRVNWTITDAGASSGLAGTKLFMNSDGGAFSPVADNLATTQADVAVTVGHT